MNINIVGVRNVSFKDAQTGNEITGKSYYYLYQDNNVIGYAADKFFVSSNVVDPFNVGHAYEVVYNRYGKFDYSKVRECENF